MARAPIGKHGRDHRLPGTLGPDDPGGHDPTPINTSLFTYAPNPAYEIDDAPDITVATNTTGDLTWAHINGTVVLDHSSATQPKVTARGVYAVCATVQTMQTMTAGSSFHVSLAAVNAGSGSTGHAASAVADLNGNAVCQVTVVSEMDVDDYYILAVTNYDTASRIFNSGAITIQRILEYS